MELGTYNIEGVRLGMSKDQVEAVIGRPTEVSASGNRWDYDSLDENPSLDIVLSFVGFTKLGKVCAVGGWRLWRCNQNIIGPTTDQDEVYRVFGTPTSDEEWVYSLEDGSQLEVTKPKSYSFVHFSLAYPHW